MSMMLLLAVLKILSFNGSGGSPSGVNVRDELNDERVNHRSLPDGRGMSNLRIYHDAGSCLWYVPMQTAMYQRIGNIPKACPYVMALEF